MDSFNFVKATDACVLSERKVEYFSVYFLMNISH